MKQYKGTVAEAIGRMTPEKQGQSKSKRWKGGSELADSRSNQGGLPDFQMTCTVTSKTQVE